MRVERRKRSTKIPKFLIYAVSAKSWTQLNTAHSQENRPEISGVSKNILVRVKEQIKI